MWYWHKKLKRENEKTLTKTKSWGEKRGRKIITNIVLAIKRDGVIKAKDRKIRKRIPLRGRGGKEEGS